ncbi:MAG: DUF4159 domain-containing protein [Spirochaetota bacterium]|nr:DUF4159 domain-containing protein [Spirochaetota bacterium]
MNVIIIITALIALPLVLLTMYSKTARGIMLKLGSYFIIKKFLTDHLKVRSLKKILLLILRLCFVGLICLLIFDPSDIEEPNRNAIFHKSDIAAGTEEDAKRYPLKLILPAKIKDRFDEDIYFIESFVKNQSSTKQGVTVIYNPTEKIINSVKHDIIIFPSIKQNRNVFGKWFETIELGKLRKESSKIAHTELSARQYFPLIIIDKKGVKKYAELENGSVIAVSFKHKTRRILLFGTGLSSQWGDFGVSGYFINITDNFLNNVSLSNKQLPPPNPLNKETSGVRSKLSFDLILKIASIIFLIELIVFSVKSFRARKTLVALFILIFSASSYAEDFKFIELSVSGEINRNSRKFFSILKQELEQKTTIKISPNYYKTHSSRALINGKMPEFPYLWIIGCKSSLKMSEKLSKSLLDFIKRGGVVFVETCGLGNDASYYQFYYYLGMMISRNLIKPSYLTKDHPVYKSFYLLSEENFIGVDASISTRRTALIIDRNNLIKRVMAYDKDAIKAAVNIVLYMLSGNYKSDQIHTRQILKRLKKRELFR